MFAVGTSEESESACHREVFVLSSVRIRKWTQSHANHFLTLTKLNIVQCSVFPSVPALPHFQLLLFCEKRSGREGWTSGSGKAETKSEFYNQEPSLGIQFNNFRWPLNI